MGSKILESIARAPKGLLPEGLENLPGINWEKAWIGIDLDGTLADTRHKEAKSHPYPCGEPIPGTMYRLKELLKLGITVKIFTARATLPDQKIQAQEWLEKQGLGHLEITATKDFSCIEMWDDRAIQFERDTGLPIDSRRQMDMAPAADLV